MKSAYSLFDMIADRAVPLPGSLPPFPPAIPLCESTEPGPESTEIVDTRAMNWENAPPRRGLHQIPPLIGPFLAKALASRLEVYRGQLKQCVRACSEESVHELRVATRRFLAQLALLDGLVPAKILKRCRKLLKERLSSLGELRDTHVQKLAVQEHALRFKGLISLHAFLERRERRLVKTAAREVRRWRLGKVADWVQSMDEALEATAASLASQRLCLKVVLRTMREAHLEALQRLKSVNPNDPATIHRVRVTFKKFRYMVESMSPDFSGLSRRDLRILANYQHRMGIIQDLEVLRNLVLDFQRRHHPHSETLPAYARYIELRRRRAIKSFIRHADRLHDFWPLPGMPVSP